MCAISTGSTRLWRRGTWSQSCRRFQAAKDGGSNHSHHWHQEGCVRCGCREAEAQLRGIRDRKSTRLNSSHRTISYAVFCLKKKKKKNITNIKHTHKLKES